MLYLRVQPGPWQTVGSPKILAEPMKPTFSSPEAFFPSVSLRPPAFPTATGLTLGRLCFHVTPTSRAPPAPLEGPGTDAGLPATRSYLLGVQERSSSPRCPPCTRRSTAGRLPNSRWLLGERRTFCYAQSHSRWPPYNPAHKFKAEMQFTRSWGDPDGREARNVNSWRLTRDFALR